MINRYVKSIVNPDYLIIIALIVLVMSIVPSIFNFELFRPFFDSFRDINITDVYYSDIRESDLVKVDDKVIIVNTEGITDLYSVKVLKLVAEAKPKVIGFFKKINIKSDSKLNNAIIKVFANIPNLITIKKDNANFLNAYATNTSSYQIATDYERQYFTTRSFKNQELISIDIARAYDSSAYKRLKQRGNSAEIINWRGGRDKYINVSGIDLLESNIDLNEFRGKIVLIGDHQSEAYQHNINLKDGFFTPLNGNRGKSYPDMNSIYLHANIISMIISGNYIDKLPDWLAVVAMLLVIYFNLFVFYWAKAKATNWYEIVSILIFCIESILILYLTILLYSEYSFDLNMNFAIIGFALSILFYELYMASLKPLFKRLVKRK